ncbi:MAG: hypothetical protein HY854_17485 [Burkholderiales bacterium]|nr:hypothetical protein [Burkholderiales bacterium]
MGFESDGVYQWDDVVGLFELRNCLVHTQGQLTDFQRSATIRAFAARHGTPMCADTAVTIDDKTSELAMAIASSVVESIYSAAAMKFPGTSMSLSRDVTSG